MNSSNLSRASWSAAGEMLVRPYPLRLRVVMPMVALWVLVPCYVVVAELTRGRMQHLPEMALDRMLSLQPAWSLIYLSYLSIPFLPILLIRHEERIRRTFLAWVMVWGVGFFCFLVYPTTLPRPGEPLGEGFFAWVLRRIYAADAPRNCFPSLHVATAFVAALSCFAVHRGVGFAAGLWAALIAISTLLTKQHYVADVIAGLFLALVAYSVFLNRCPHDATSESDRRAAPILMAGLIGVYGIVVTGFWAFYLVRVR